MNKNWSDANKFIQNKLSKESSYKDAVKKLLELRFELFSEIKRLSNEFSEEEFSSQPFLKATGYHNETMAFCVWHVFRIEDICAHELIERDQQIFFREDFGKKIGTDSITTGNELEGAKIQEFSKTLKIAPLIEYAEKVMESSNEIIENLDYAKIRSGFAVKDRQRLIETSCISDSSEAAWLIDYWCGKDVRGLLKMPFSRHWIMHVEAMLRIAEKIKS